MFSTNDLQHIKHKGIDMKTIEQQLDNFRKGFPYIHLIKPAVKNHGILTLDQDTQNRYEKKYKESLPLKRVCKFIPASGAASRMFKDLYGFIELYEGKKEGYSSFMQNSGLSSIVQFFNRIRDFAFYEDLKNIVAKKGKDIDALIQQMDYMSVFNALLKEDGLHYGFLPKGLIKFHRYGSYSRTSAEEHLVEGANYCRDLNDIVSLHFTVSPEHRILFEKYLLDVKLLYERAFNVKYNMALSIQKPSTDMIAVDEQNEPFRNKDGSLLFRPGGHGALLQNLNDLNADLIFIKNIDNVAPDRMKIFSDSYKRAMAGLMLHYQEKVFDYMKTLNDPLSKEDETLLSGMLSFLENELCIIHPVEIRQSPAAVQHDYILSKLNRPIRVCGMVKNEGEPGGGPYWVKNADGSVSLQIIEMLQINTRDEEQKKITEQSTHFNPVDIVCGVKNFRGEKFNLPDFCDPQQGFISIKSKDGKDLKAQELPGLWNGSMADWNTLFVEVPIETFNPVKTVSDLLRPEHQ